MKTSFDQRLIVERKFLKLPIYFWAIIKMSLNEFSMFNQVSHHALTFIFVIIGV